MSNPLSEDQILALLTGKPRQRSTKKKSETAQPKQHVRPIQLGPLGWSNEVDTCVSRGCRSSTLVRINRVTYCVTHALYKLNEMLITDYDLSQCDCRAGRESYNNLHTENCPLFVEKKLRDTELIK